MQIIPAYKLHDGIRVELSYTQYDFDYSMYKKKINGCNSSLKGKDKYRTTIGNRHANTKHIQAQSWIHGVLF